MKFFDSLKKWITGGKKKKNTTTEKIKEANRVTNYGGGYTSNNVGKKTATEISSGIRRAKREQEKKQSQQQQTYSSTFKATPPSVKKAEAKDKQTSKKSKQSNPFKASAPPKVTHQSTALGTMSKRDTDTRTAKKNAYEINRKYQSRAADRLKPLIDKKYDASTAEGRQRIKMGDYQSDPNVMKYETLKHPIASSLARGGLSGATFGLSELGMHLLPKSKEVEEAERLYQANKSKGAEFAGEMAGSLLGFGLTGDLSKQAVTKLAPNKVAKLGEGATEFIAKNGLVRSAAEREAIRKLGTTATKEEIEHFAKARAAKLVAALGEDAAINLTTGAVSDISHAIIDSDNPVEFVKNMGISALGNVALGGVTSAVPALRGGNVDDAFVRNRLAAREGLDDLARRNRIGMGRPTDLNIPKLNAFSDASDAVARYPAVEDAYLDYDGTMEAVNRYFDPEATAEAAADRYRDLEVTRGAPRVKEEPKAELPKATEPKAEVKTEPPKAESKKKKKPQTREEKLANSNGLDQYNARAEHQEQRFQEGYEKADNVRAVLEGKEQKTPAKGAKPAADNLKKKGGTTPKETKSINLDDTVNKKREKKTFREQFHELASSVKTKVSDSLNAFEEANKQYIRTDHQKWLENVGAIDKTRRYNAIASRSIDDAQVKWNGDVYEGGKSLKAIYDGMDEATEKDFDKYLLMRHAPDRIREGKPIFAGTQYDSIEACEREAKALLDKHPEFAERAEELYQYTRNELQNRVDAGLLKQEVADEWNKKYPNYVPTGRDGDFSGDYDIWDIRGQLKGNTIGAGEIQKAKGGDQPIRSIKEQLADATSRNWRDMSMNNLFRKMFGDSVGDELATYADGGLEKVLDNTINLSKTKDGGKYFAEVFDNGEMKRVEIEKRFYDAIEDLYKNGRFGNGIDVMTDAASKVAYPFKQLVTSWNPIFMVKNGMRDFPEAIINSRQTKEFLECMPAAMKELQSGGEFYQAFRNSGVSQANFVNLEEALTSGDNWLKRKANKFATAQEMVETYPRLIEYMATIKKAGYDLKKGIKDVPMEIRDIAAANAADVTVNFGRSGSVGKMLNRGLVPFFNPSVQGWSKFLRNLSEQGSAKAFIGFSVKALALGAGVQTVNNLVLEDNPNYQQISARDKATNIIIPITWGKDVTKDNTNLFVKIPKSRFAATLSLPMVNAGNENKMGWAEMINVAKDQVAPVDPSESNILSPLLLAKQNKTWYGSPIVPKALEDLPKSEQYDANTSLIGKALGKATANLPEELQISPKKADYILDAETGVIGDFALPALTPSRQGGGNALQKAGHSTLNVLKRSFTIDSVTQNDLSTRFYDKMQKANTASQSAKGTQEDKDEYTRLSGYSKEVSKINKAITALQNGNRKTKQEDIYGLQKVRNQMMQDAIDGKDVPSEYKAMDAVQKYVGTSYAINHFGSSADKEAMKVYGAAKYGGLSNTEMRKAINADKDFYKGVQSIGKLQGKMKNAGIDSDTTLTRAIALASVDASDELFGAYQCTKQSRTETANKMERAKTYFKSGGSLGEYVKLEKCRKTLGKLSDFDRDAENKKNYDRLKSGEISEAEYYKKQGEIKYNANISYVGLSTSLAQANSPERGYRVYDIKDKNIQKGINLAAMGFTARDYREMAKAVDADGNGYPKKQEIIDYVSRSNVEDKATLYDALYYYQGKYNPFGTPTKYTRAQAADAGKAKGVKWITNERDDIEVKPEESSGNGWRYYGRGWHRWHRWGSYHRKGRAITSTSPAFNARKAKVTSSGSKPTPPRVKSGSSSSSGSRSSGAGYTGSRSSGSRSSGLRASGGTSVSSGATNVKSTASRMSSNPKIKVTPLNIKAVKAKGGTANLSAALEDIKKTEKKVAPPKARRGK